MKRGIKPDEVDKMDADLVDNLMHLKCLEGEKEQFANMADQNKIKLEQWFNGIRDV